MSTVLGVRNLHLLRVSSIAFAGVLGATGLVLLTSSPAAAYTCVPNGPGVWQCFFTDTTARAAWPVPAGVTRLDQVYLRGGDGGDAQRLAPGGGSGSVTGGQGGETHAANVPVTPGSTITFYIGDIGEPGPACGGGKGGAGGLSSGVAPVNGVGGAGGAGGTGQNGACSGGGGGGGTFMMAGNAEPGAATPMLAAGGGGGAGGAINPTGLGTGGNGGGDGNAADGAPNNLGGKSGDNGGAGGMGAVNGGDSVVTNGGTGAAGTPGGGGGGGGYCGGGGGASPASTAAANAGGGGGGEGFDQGDTGGANPCDVPGPFVTTSVPTRHDSTEQRERATLTEPGSAYVIYHVGSTRRTPNQPHGPRNEQERGHGQCNHDPGYDPSNDPNNRTNCRPGHR